MVLNKFGQYLHKRKHVPHDMKGERITSLGEPTGDNDAATKIFVLSNALCKNDDGDFDVNNGNIKNLSSPVDVFDCVNKEYVDSKIDAIIINDSIFNTKNEVISVNNKRVTDIARPLKLKDAVNLKYLRDFTLVLDGDSYNARNKRIENVMAPQNALDALNYGTFAADMDTFMKLNTITYHKSTDKFTAGGKKITDVSDPSEEADVVTLGYLKRLLKLQ